MKQLLEAICDLRLLCSDGMLFATDLRYLFSVCLLMMKVVCKEVIRLLQLWSCMQPALRSLNELLRV